MFPQLALFPFVSLSLSVLLEKRGRGCVCIFKWKRHLMVFKIMVLLIRAKVNTTSLAWPMDAPMNTQEKVQ